MSRGRANGPLVLLHGFTGGPGSWNEVRRHLDPATRVLAPAVLGHDGTPGHAAVECFGDEVDRLAGVIREWIAGDDPAPARARIVGYSLGGRLALGLLIRHPDLFGSAVLIGVHPGLADAADRRARRERDEEWARLLDTEGLSTFVAAWERLPLFGTQERLPASALAEQARIRRSHDAHGLARSLRLLGLGAMPDYRPQLASIAQPVRLVVGEADERFRALAVGMARRIPGAKVHVVGGAGHNVVLERPANVARIIQEPDQ